MFYNIKMEIFLSHFIFVPYLCVGFSFIGLGLISFIGLVSLVRRRADASPSFFICQKLRKSSIYEVFSKQNRAPQIIA